MDCKSALPVFLVMAVSVGVSDGRADERSSLTLQALLSSWTSKSEPWPVRSVAYTAICA